MIASINPATGELIRKYEETTSEQVEALIQRAAASQRKWAAFSFSERGAILSKAAQVLRTRRDELARLMALEMGKPVTQGRAEVDKCAWVCEYYAQHAEALLREEHVPTEAYASYVAFRPLGLILAVMPWNFPFWQVFRCAAPALMAGNGVVLKHASNVPGCALAIEEVFRQAGVLDGAFTSLLIGSEKVQEVIEHPLITGVTLTGSTPAGGAVAAAAGRALKKSVLELGGSDPYIVLADADLERAAEACVTARLLNAGQTCIAAKRLIVVDEVRDEFQRIVLAKLRTWNVGDPLDESTRVGPLARIDLREELAGQVARSISAGARPLLGCEIPPGPGAWYPVSLLTDVHPGMPAFDEELFGPVAVIVPAHNEDHAIDLANQSRFGLGAAIFSKDIERAERIAADRLIAGSVFVNDFVKSDPRLPFGGVKFSGYGRELGSYGIKEFVNIKTVVVAK